MLRYHNSRDSPDYALCNMTVTLYHVVAEKENVQYIRTVISTGAFLDFRKNAGIDKTGSREANSFLLILPQGAGGMRYVPPAEYVQLADAEQAACYTLAPGDKVCLGTHEDISNRAAWAALIPSTTFGVGVIQAVDPKFYHNKLVHVEAGG